VDISTLKIGDNILVESLLSDDFTILHPENTVVVQVKTARSAVVVETDEEEGEIPEGEAAAEGADTTSEEAAEDKE